MKVKVKRIHPDAIIPKKATTFAACFDIHTTSEGYADGGHFFKTGLTFEIPEGYVMLIFSRSGHGFNHNVRLANCVGVIDSDWRGEVMIKLADDSFSVSNLRMPKPLFVMKGDRIAQAMIVPVLKIEMVEADELSDTERGDNGLGSTGYGKDWVRLRPPLPDKRRMCLAAVLPTPSGEDCMVNSENEQKLTDFVIGQTEENPDA